jgi:hypothetical protein
MKESMQPSAHEQEMSAQTEDLACQQTNKESMQPSAHRQEEMSAQTEDMAC